jgi:hypothetical protein
MSQHPGIQGELRKLLQQLCDGPEEGATVASLARMIGRRIESTRYSLKAMPDTYIDRYVYLEGCRRPSAIWMIVTPPPDCPLPGKRKPGY